MKIKQLAICAALGLTSVVAHSADNTFRIGVAHVNVDSKSPNLTSNGPAFLTPQPAGITVGDATTLLLGYTRRLDANWDVDFLLGVPPTHSIKGTGTLAPFGEIATIKAASPTVMLNYNFGAEGSAWRPFVGLGVNFTHFYDRTSTAAGNLAGGGPTKVSLTNSTGLAAQAGFNYKLTKEWGLSAAIAMAKVETDMTTTSGSITRKTMVDLRPVVFTLGVTYGF